MVLNKEILVEAILSKLEILYRIFRLVSKESRENKNVYRDVRYGIHFEFDINDYFNKMYQIQGDEVLLFNGKKVSKKEFYQEFELREDLLREVLHDYLEDICLKDEFKSNI
ncbi:MAG: hypothetical protein VXZ40_04235 [Nanoarchaeota archaeon]|nr:hypothetical protein [Nanoarchaeota archaeon]